MMFTIFSGLAVKIFCQDDGNGSKNCGQLKEVPKKTKENKYLLNSVNNYAKANK